MKTPPFMATLDSDQTYDQTNIERCRSRFILRDATFQVRLAPMTKQIKPFSRTTPRSFVAKLEGVTIVMRGSAGTTAPTGATPATAPAAAAATAGGGYSNSNGSVPAQERGRGEHHHHHQGSSASSGAPPYHGEGESQSGSQSGRERTSRFGCRG